MSLPLYSRAVRGLITLQVQLYSSCKPSPMRRRTTLLRL